MVTALALFARFPVRMTRNLRKRGPYYFFQLQKMDFNGQMVVPTENSEIDNHGRNMGRKKEKKEKDRLDMEKRYDSSDLETGIYY